MVLTVAGIRRPFVILLAGVGFRWDCTVLGGRAVRLAVVLRVSGLIPGVVRSGTKIEEVEWWKS